MGGQIDLDSEPGKGSTFSFAADFEHGACQLTNQRQLNLSDKCVLVVDDNATNRNILREQMEAWGIQVVDVDGGASALAYLENAVAEDEQQIGLALVDSHMPGMDGAVVISAIRKIPALDSLPIVLMSSAANSLTVDEGEDLPLAARLTKPVRQSDLRTCLESIFTANEHNTHDDSAPSEPRFSARVLLVEDNPVNQQVAASMLQSMGCTVDLANDGIEGVEAFEQQSYDVVLMDCQMPRLDGFEATRRIRASEASQGVDRTTIIAVTANALSGDRAKCIKAGMDCYLSKPFTLKELGELLAEQLPDDFSVTRTKIA